MTHAERKAILLAKIEAEKLKQIYEYLGCTEKKEEDMAYKKKIKEPKAKTVIKQISHEFIPGDYLLRTAQGTVVGPVTCKTADSLNKQITKANSNVHYISQQITDVFAIAGSFKIAPKYAFFTEVEVPEESPEGFLPEGEMRTAEV